MDKIKEIKRNNILIKVISPAEKENVITPRDKEMDIRAQEAVKAAILKAEVCKKPVAKYDSKTKRAYLQYPDGRKVNI